MLRGQEVIDAECVVAMSPQRRLMDRKLGHRYEVRQNSLLRELHVILQVTVNISYLQTCSNILIVILILIFCNK